MEIKEVIVQMHMHIHNMPEIKTKRQIADFISEAIYEDPDFFGTLHEDNILDVRVYEQPDR
jgi:hypothetical protein